MTDYSRYRLMGTYDGEEILNCMTCSDVGREVSWEDVQSLSRAIELADEHEAGWHTDP